MNPSRDRVASTEFFQQLERRALLTASLDGGTLNIDGTPAGDVIVVSAGDQPGQVVVTEGESGSEISIFDDVLRIRIRTGPGDDLIDVGTILRGDGQPISALVHSGRGDDVVTTGDGNDRIRTGNGDDTVVSGGGNDLVRSGRGADRVEGKAGFDRLFGGPGDDELNGGDDVDELRGGRGNDTVRRANDDVLTDESFVSGPVANIGRRMEVGNISIFVGDRTAKVLQFNRVVEDSRCPIGIDCQQIGEFLGSAILEMEFGSLAGIDPVVFQISSHPSGQPGHLSEKRAANVAVIDGFRITIESVTPHPIWDGETVQTVEPDDYEIVVTIVEDKPDETPELRVPTFTGGRGFPSFASSEAVILQSQKQFNAFIVDHLQAPRFEFVQDDVPRDSRNEPIAPPMITDVDFQTQSLVAVALPDSEADVAEIVSMTESNGQLVVTARGLVNVPGALCRPLFLGEFQAAPIAFAVIPKTDANAISANAIVVETPQPSPVVGSVCA